MSVRDLVLDKAYPLLYRMFAMRPVDENRILVLEHLKEGLDDSFARIYGELAENDAYEVEFVSTAHHLGALKNLVNHVKLVRAIARSRAVFLRSASALISSLPIRPETNVIQLWHACGAFKRFGLSTADMRYGPSRKEHLRHPAYDNLSLVTVSSEEVAWAYREGLGYEDKPEVVKALGISRTDVFFDDEYAAAARSLMHTYMPYLDGRKVLLYAPTFRGESYAATAPDALDIPLLKRALGDDYLLIIKHHPQVREVPPIPQGCEDFAHNAKSGWSVNDLLFVTDVCITDYSSLVFEWSLFERPIAFFAYDLDDYLDERGFYYDFDTMTPGPVCKSTQELADWVRTLDEGFDPSEVVAFRERFMGACDGHATERILHEALGS